MRSVLSSTLKLVLGIGLSANAWGVMYGVRDPAFSRVPFEQWMTSTKGSQFKWSVEVAPAILSTHQRMLHSVAVTVDGREFEKRRGAGEFIAFVQYQDATGHLWQSHTSMDLSKMQTGMQSRNIVIRQYAFVLPGDYSVALAVWDTTTGEHSAVRRRVHVGAVTNDPLPTAWNGLPSVEFIPVGDVPDLWYLPEVQGKLNLPVETSRPVHVEVLVNTTPSERSSGSLGAFRRNMNLLVPAMKSLSAMRLSQGSVKISLLDLTHRKLAFEQKNADVPDWTRMRPFFLETTPGMVDVATLANEWKMRGYFLDEVTRRMSVRDGAAHVVIVLSGPAFMDGQAPAEAAWETADPDHRLLYIRYRPDPLRSFGPRRFRPGARPTLPPAAMIRPMPVDDLEHVVEPLHPRLFDAVSAEQFRRIMAAVIEEIAHL